MATKEDLEEAKKKRDLEELERKSKLAAWNDYISFGVQKVGGVAGVVVGGLELIDPTIIAAQIPHPDIVFGSSFALLAGKGVLKMIITIAKALDKK